MKRILLLLLLPTFCFAALPYTTVWEVRGVGSDANGGGFDSAMAGTDYSQQNSAQYSGTNLTSANATSAPCTVASVTHNFVSADVGNFIHISAGTNWTAGIYEINSVAANAAVLDTSCGSSAVITGGTWAEGGALATIGTLFNYMTVGNMTAYVSSGTVYQISATLTTNSGLYYTTVTNVIGYGTVRGDNGRPVIIATNTVTDVVDLAGDGLQFRNFEVNCNAKAQVGIMSLGPYNNNMINDVAHGCSNVGLYSNNAIIVIMNCESYGNTNYGIYFGIKTTVINSYVHDNTGTGIYGGGGTYIGNIVYHNTGSTSDGIRDTEYPITVVNNICDSNGRHGINNSAYNIGSIIQGNILTNNGGYGLETFADMVYTSTNPTYGYNAYYNNTSGAIDGAYKGVGDVILTGSPYTSAPSNWALNNTAGAGASLRNAGYPGVITPGVGTGYADIGPLRHQDPSGGGGGTKGWSWSQ